MMFLHTSAVCAAHIWGISSISWCKGNTCVDKLMSNPSAPATDRHRRPVAHQTLPHKLHFQFKWVSECIMLLIGYEKWSTN